MVGIDTERFTLKKDTYEQTLSIFFDGKRINVTDLINIANKLINSADCNDNLKLFASLAEK